MNHITLFYDKKVNNNIISLDNSCCAVSQRPTGRHATVPTRPQGTTKSASRRGNKVRKFPGTRPYLEHLLTELKKIQNGETDIQKQVDADREKDGKEQPKYPLWSAKRLAWETASWLDGSGELYVS